MQHVWPTQDPAQEACKRRKIACRHSKSKDSDYGRRRCHREAAAEKEFFRDADDAHSPDAGIHTVPYGGLRQCVACGSDGRRMLGGKFENRSESVGDVEQGRLYDIWHRQKSDPPVMYEASYIIIETHAEQNTVLREYGVIDEQANPFNQPSE